jgi:hypothetical protein
MSTNEKFNEEEMSLVTHSDDGYAPVNETSIWYN